MWTPDAVRPENKTIHSSYSTLNKSNSCRQLVSKFLANNQTNAASIEVSEYLLRAVEGGISAIYGCENKGNYVGRKSDHLYVIIKISTFWNRNGFLTALLSNLSVLYNDVIHFSLKYSFSIT